MSWELVGRMFRCVRTRFDEDGTRWTFAIGRYHQRAHDMNAEILTTGALGFKRPVPRGNLLLISEERQPGRVRKRAAVL